MLRIHHQQCLAQRATSFPTYGTKRNHDQEKNHQSGTSARHRDASEWCYTARRWMDEPKRQRRREIRTQGRKDEAREALRISCRDNMSQLNKSENSGRDIIETNEARTGIGNRIRCENLWLFAENKIQTNEWKHNNNRYNTIVIIAIYVAKRSMSSGSSSSGS